MIQTDQRDELMNHLKEKGIDTKIHYPIPIHQQRAFKNLYGNPFELPVTERIVKRILSLPIYPELEEEQTDYVVTSIIDFFT